MEQTGHKYTEFPTTIGQQLVQRNFNSWFIMDSQVLTIKSGTMEIGQETQRAQLGGNKTFL